MMKPFCVLPYVQFSTTVSGDYQACCIAKQQKENIIDISPLEFINVLLTKRIQAIQKDYKIYILLETIKLVC